MNNINLKNITEQLIDSFLKAGELAKEISRIGVKITIKSDKSPVTNADLAINKLLIDKIRNLTPNIPIISEETVNLQSDSLNGDFWLIDPIDGTKDYIQKKDEYTLNAGLIINYKPAIGIVNAPAKKRLFFSYGKGFAFELRNKEKLVLKK